jgi:DNA-directed RNA polymerase specialized sigma24 family protein
MQQHPEHDPQQPLGFEQHLPVSLDTTRGTIGLPGIGPDDSDPDIEEVLVQVDPYIVAQVEKILAGRPDIAPRMERDELAQRVRINLWYALQERPIRNIKAYVRRIVHNEYVNVLRGREPPLPLPVTEDGEMLEGNILVTPGEGMADPAFEIEEQEAVAKSAEKAAAAISTLPPRQKDAMTALLHERLDNLIQVVDSFKEFDMDIAAARWPAEEGEKRLLKASISAARRSVARSMNIDLKLCKKKGASFFHLN